MHPKNWITEFLGRHNYSKPDGRLLYQYRLTDQEFESLKQVMSLSSMLGVTMVAKELPRWDAAFVLYAAEWWRREYDGSSWSWAKIFASFKADYQEMNTFTRNHMVETGLRYWRRNVRILNGQSRYLGTVAIEGGLPLNQLTGSGGWLGRIFKLAIPKYIRLQSAGISASMIVSEYADYFPKTYRNEQIYSILGDMVQTIAELKKEYQLEQRSNPVDWLDSHASSWREKFPLPLDQDVSTTLLSDMVNTAIKSPESMGVPFRAIRQLSNDHALEMHIELLPFVFLEDVFSSKSPEDIPTRMEVELLGHLGETQNIGFAFKTTYQSKPAIKLNRTHFRVKGEELTEGYFIRFKFLGEVILDIPLVGGEELDKEAPWVFIKKNDDWVFDGAASVSTRSSKVRISYPENFSCRKGEESSSLIEIKTTKKRKVIEAEGVVICVDNQENIFIIKTNQAGQNPVSYYLTGKILNFQSSPKDVFKGFPQLMCVDKESGIAKEVAASLVLARPINTKGNFKNILQVTPGVYEIRLQDSQGSIKFRKKCTLLDENFDIRLVPGGSPLEGKINLTNSGQSVVCCGLANDQNKTEVNTEVNGHCIQLIADSAPPPAVVPIMLSWQGIPEILQISVPFPARGGQLIAAGGEQCSKWQTLFQDKLHGYRLRLFSERPDKLRVINLDLNLVDSAVTDVRDLYFSKLIKVKGQIFDLAIIDYLQWINELLSISRSLDSYVKMTIREGGTDLISITVSQYQMNLIRNDADSCVEIAVNDNTSLSYDQVEQVSLMAMRLSQPEQQHIKLEPKLSENTEVGCWLFDAEKREPGPWIIYPASDSSISFRPILWFVQSPCEVDIPDITSLHTAVTIGNQLERNVTINKFLSEMCSDFQHSGWEYLRTLWNKCSHLPLATFDVWSLAVSNTRFIAALAIHMDDKFISHIATELPVFWELIPLTDWFFVFEQYKGYLQSFIDDESDINDLVNRKIGRMGELSDSMDIISRILLDRVLNISDQELDFMKLPMAVSVISDGVHDAYQDLCRTQADSEWPEMLSSELMQQWSKLDSAVQNILPRNQLPHHMPVMVLPILLSSFVLTSPVESWVGDPSHIFKIKQLKIFDERWFSSVFKYIVAYQSQQKEKVKVNG